jgi:hypothetical protein
VAGGALPYSVGSRENAEVTGVIAFDSHDCASRVWCGSSVAAQVVHAYHGHDTACRYGTSTGHNCATDHFGGTVAHRYGTSHRTTTTTDDHHHHHPTFVDGDRLPLT